MAVVQISRIQIRRGKAQSGTGFPQLASGEMGWAIDTQELYIGNGAVAEGSPAVGNTKILTQNDLTAQGNLLQQLEHIYRSGDPSIDTGESANNPVSRKLQARLDDRVTVADFITDADILSGDYTKALQRAVAQLFLNPTTKASDDNAGTPSRVVLEMAPGIYDISDTIYIPSYASLVGAGAEKTIIRFTGTGPAFQLVNDDSTFDKYTGLVTPGILTSSFYITQPRYINISGLTLHTLTDDQPALQLDAARECTFTDLLIKGNWANTVNIDSKGILLNASTTLVTSERNLFKNVSVTGFTYGVYSKEDSMENVFEDCFISDVRQGFVLGLDADQGRAIRSTHISKCKFEDIKWHAVYVDQGTGVTVTDCVLVNVGNDGGNNTQAAWPQIYFNEPGNHATAIRSDRTEDLAQPILIIASGSLVIGTSYTILDQGGTIFTALGSSSNSAGTVFTATGTGLVNATNLVNGRSYTITTVGSTVWTNFGASSNTVGVEFVATGPGTGNGTAVQGIGTVGLTYPTPYYPEVTGPGVYSAYSSRVVYPSSHTGYGDLFRLPVSTDGSGTPNSSINYVINYIYKSLDNNFSRRGVITIAADVTEGYVQMSDEYDFSASSSNTREAVLDFKVVLLDSEGVELSPGASGAHTLVVKWTNTDDTGYMSYTYTSYI